MMALSMDEIVRAVNGRMPVPCRPFRVTGVSTDTRTIRPGDLFVALSGENFDGHTFVTEAFAHGACAALTAASGAPPVSNAGASAEPLITADDTRVALGRLAAYYRQQLPAKIIAVTGSNGKTTTKGMIHQVLGSAMPGRAADRSYNNDVGVPLTLLSAEPADTYVVVEIGSSAPGEVAQLAALASPDIGVVTSLGHAHLEGFGGIDGVVREKLSLLEHVVSGGLGVVNLDDLNVHAQRGTAGVELNPRGLRTITYGTDPQADVRVTDLQCGLDGVIFKINERYQVHLPVPGAHNALNAAAAFAVARRLRLEPEQIAEALAGVELPEMRLHVRRINGLTVIEDCYNANPTSMAAGIEVLSTVRTGRRVLIAGEMLELGADSGALHEGIGVLAGRSGIDLVVSVGGGASPVVDGARSLNEGVAVHACASTAHACAEVPPLLAEGDTILIKGSRAVGLERLTRSIVERFCAVAPDGG